MPRSVLVGTSWLVAALAVLGASLTGTGAMAACFESGIGCTDDHAIPSKLLNQLSCDTLWTVRNTIYDENGYCFQTRKGKSVFSNDGCHITDASRVPLNGYERTNIARILKVESKKGCR